MEISWEWQAFEGVASLPLLGRAQCGAFQSTSARYYKHGRGASCGTMPGNCLGHLISVGVIRHELNPQLFFLLHIWFHPITHTHTVPRKSQIWSGSVWGGRWKALFLHPVWKYDLLFILKAGWGWRGAWQYFLVLWRCRLGDMSGKWQCVDLSWALK